MILIMQIFHRFLCYLEIICLKWVPFNDLWTEFNIIWLDNAEAAENKVFWKYTANLQKNTRAEVRLHLWMAASDNIWHQKWKKNHYFMPQSLNSFELFWNYILFTVIF